MKKNHLKMTVNRKIHVRISKKHFWYVFGPCVNRWCEKKIDEKKILIFASLIAINYLTIWCDNYADKDKKKFQPYFFGTDGNFS